MDLTERLLAEGSKIWETFHSHPFVKGIADGTLDPEKFKHFMVQDYLYLLEYAKVFAIGTAKAATPELMQQFAAYVQQIFNGELNIHRAYMARLGITEEEAAQAASALDNLSYTSYMLRCAYEGGPAEVCAAILPCAVSYEVLACSMVEENPDCVKHPFYGEWISGYADPGYHEANEALKALTRAVTENCSEEDALHLIQIARNCCRYEGSFWDMSWELRH